MVILEEQNYNQNIRAYNEIKNQLKKQINKVIEVSHVGSTSIPSIKYGKNIIDILIGVKDKKEFAEIAKILESINYIPSDKSKTEEYQFFASTKEETKSGDIHIHLALKDTNRYKEFILLKEYLLENEKEAIAYSNFKQKLIEEKTIIESSIDELVKKGVAHIKRSGNKITTRSGKALQSNNVTYVLTDCSNRVHTLRSEKSIPYFAKELLAYFCGSLNINGKYGYGLVNASKFWDKISDDNDCINSNYGYYIFYQLTSENKTQLQWIREQFIKNIDTRRALININGIQHKIKTKDFLCTVGILFRIENNILNCDVQSRSTDVITGLPYDMGFFSVITELLANLLTSDLNEKIIPGYVAMHSSFTQIYDKTAKIADKVEFANKKIELQRMPEITNGEELLEDIYNLEKRLPKTKFMEWSIVNAK